MFENVDAPSMVAFPGGLTSLGRDETPAGTRWITGYQYPDTSLPRTARNWDNNRTVAGTNLGTGADPELVQVVPVLLEVESTFSAFAAKEQEWENLARQQLEIYTSRMLERELWTGEIATAVDPDLPNKFLAAPGATSATATAREIKEAIGALVEAGAVTIHVPAFLGARLPPEWRNNDALDTEGFVVIAGRGYPVDAVSGGLTIYGTAPVNFRLSDIDTSITSFDHASNTFSFLAQRYGAADFAGPVYAATVTY